MEEKVDKERATINDLLEKMNTMERRNEERMTKMMKKHKLELNRARNNYNNDDGCGWHRTNGDSGGGGERDSKRSRYDAFDERENNRKFEEKRATNRLKWEKRLAEKLDKRGSGWAAKREWHDPDMINWGGYCHTHGYDPIGKNHDSANCNSNRYGKGGPTNGHDKSATRTNRKGGSEDNKPL